MPCSVSTSRSSNRTGGFPASGSRTRFMGSPTSGDDEIGLGSAVQARNGSRPGIVFLEELIWTPLPVVWHNNGHVVGDRGRDYCPPAAGSPDDHSPVVGGDCPTGSADRGIGTRTKDAAELLAASQHGASPRQVRVAKA